jgi:PAS domain S-box-containing protein
MKKPTNEIERLARLRSYGVLDTSFERHYNDLTRLAAMLCETPMAAISLVDEHRTWFKGSYGVPDAEIPREHTICARTILSEVTNVIGDLSADDGYRELPHVSGFPFFRAYLGVPLVTSDGFVLGTICALDTKPREFTANQISGMEALARQVMTQLELGNMNRALARSEATLREEREYFKLMIEDLQEVIFRADFAGRWTYLNPAWTSILGFSTRESLGTSLFNQVLSEDRASLEAELAPLLAGETNSVRANARFRTKSGTQRVLELFAKRSTGPNGEALIAGTLTDLTSMLSSHAHALQREQDINSFFTSSPFYMGLAELRDEDIYFVSVNPAAQRLLNAEGHSFPALGSAIGMRDSVIAYWRSKYIECMEAGGIMSFETTFGEGAEARWLRVYMSQVNRGSAELPRFSFLTNDITDERRRQETIVSQRHLLESISEHVGDVIWMANVPSGEIIFVSKAYERLWGKSREDLLADRSTFLEPIHPEDRDRVVRALPRQPSGGYEEVYRIKSPRGERWMRDRAFPVRDAAGNVVQLVGIASDITDVRQREEAVRRAKENLELVIGHLPLAVCVYNAQGLREFVNEEWTQLLGWTQAEVAGTPVPAAMFKDGETARAAREFPLRSGETREFPVRTKSGELKDFLVTAVQLPAGRSMTLSRDLSKERAQQKLIEEQRQAMIESARLSSLGEMAAGVAHEINNPLAIIQGSADLVIAAIERGGIEEEKLKRAMDRIHGQPHREDHRRAKVVCTRRPQGSARGLFAQHYCRRSAGALPDSFSQ